MTHLQDLLARREEIVTGLEASSLIERMASNNCFKVSSNSIKSNEVNLGDKPL
jgi:hypothetical protein